MPLSRNGFLKVTASRRERIVMTAFRKRRSAVAPEACALLTGLATRSSPVRRHGKGTIAFSARYWRAMSLGSLITALFMASIGD
jgi:hypothetical protein